MKKLLLLIAGGFIISSVNAQQNQSILFRNSVQEGYHAIQPSSLQNARTAGKQHTANKTTFTGGRWYSYENVLENQFTSDFVGLGAPYLWNDSTSLDVYSGPTTVHNTLVSVGDVFDPTYSGFNDVNFYAGQMQLLPTNSYSVDSIEIVGIYGLNPADSNVVDTLRCGFLYGNATGTGGNIIGVGYSGEMAHYGVNNLHVKDVYHDSVQNRITDASYTGTGVIYVNFPLGKTTYGDTDANGNHYVHAAIPTLNVPAGKIVAMSFSFKTGDPSYHPNDTVFTDHTPGLYKHNMFRPLLAYKNAGAGTPAVFAAYDSTNYNEGVYKQLPNDQNGYGGIYVPMWAFTTANGAAASDLQYPLVSYHVTCATCATLNVANVTPSIKMSAYPNPATSEVNIPFTIAQAANVNVTMTNTIGQVVRTQNMGNVAHGTATFSTNGLAAGVYFYTVEANGARSTGRVVVAH